MLRSLSVAAGLCLLCALGPAYALGLGQIQVSSGLNQPFQAVIPFSSLTQAESGEIRARIADNAQFERAGVERIGYLSSITVEVVSDDGHPRLVLSSRELAREPMLRILVEVRTAGGGPRLLREYTVLLDPPGQPGSAAAPAPVPAPAPAQAPGPTSQSEFFETTDEAAAPATAATPPPVRVVGAVPPAASAVNPDRYGPVRAGDTLSSVADRVSPPQAVREQTMLAIYEANPKAFIEGDINRLGKGANLSIPAADQIMAVSPRRARARIAELAAATAPASTAAAESSEAASAPGAAEPAEEPAAAPAAAAAAPATEQPAAEAEVPAAEAEEPVVASEPAAPAEGGSAPEAEGATPAGETAAEPAEAAPAAEVATPASAEAGTQAAAGEASAEPAPTAAAPAAAAAEKGSSWVDRLWPLLLVLLLALGGIAVIRRMRERMAQKEYETASTTVAKMPSPRAGATGTIGKTAMTARDELEALEDRIAEEDRGRGPADDEDDDRTRIDPVATSRIPAYTGTPVAAAPTAPEEGSDPLAEAEFHIAYGLYDEAAALLERAVDKDPGRVDLGEKLVETYFGAGDAAAFTKAAGRIKGRVGDDAWGKIVIMGRQLAPDAPLFAGSDAGEVAVDLAFEDEPAATAASGGGSDALDFRIEELELPTQPTESADPAKKDAGLDFDLGEFQLGGGEGATPADDSVSGKDFDLGQTDLTGPGPRELDVSLDEIQPMDLDQPLEPADLDLGDEVGTKLDLARAYVEMGDQEMARSLLDEVTEQGSEEQKQEAAALRDRLTG